MNFKLLFIFSTLLFSSWGQENDIQYHDNGFIAEKTFISKSGVISHVFYSDSLKGCPIHGGNQYEDNYTFKNCKLVSKESVKDGWEMSMEMPVSYSLPYCVQTGQFQNYILNNGTIKYYSRYHKLITTVDVVSGKRVNDPVVYFKDSILEKKLVSNRSIDMNHNGHIEVSEASVASKIYIRDGNTGITNLYGLSYFKNLETIEVRGFKIDPNRFETDRELLEEIEKRSKRDVETLPRIAIPVPPPMPIMPDVEVVPEAVIIDFPDVGADFPGGIRELQIWINENIIYPETSIEMEDQGSVYISFVVELDGSISNVKVEKGVARELDREAKRLVRNMPKWIPAKAGEKDVRSRCRLPIVFVLPESK